MAAESFVASGYQGTTLRAIAASVALTDDRVREACRSYFESEMLARLADHIGGRDATRRALAVMSLVSGTLLTRHALGLAPHLAPDEPLRSLEPLLHSLLNPR